MTNTPDDLDVVQRGIQELVEEGIADPAPVQTPGAVPNRQITLAPPPRKVPPAQPMRPSYRSDEPPVPTPEPPATGTPDLAVTVRALAVPPAATVSSGPAPAPPLESPAAPPRAGLSEAPAPEQVITEAGERTRRRQRVMYLYLPLAVREALEVHRKTAKLSRGAVLVTAFANQYQFLLANYAPTPPDPQDRFKRPVRVRRVVDNGGALSFYVDPADAIEIAEIAADLGVSVSEAATMALSAELLGAESLEH